MKSEILKILQMQQDGKLTQDQAAELLAILADQAREKESSGATDAMCSSAGRNDSKRAPGPQARSAGDCGTWTAASALHGIVDTAVGIGATVGRAATVWGGEFAHMVHREQAGNTITMSKVDEPAGVDFVFRDNSINVSKLSGVTLNHAEVAHNGINASKIGQVSITGGRLNQCQISGSSISQVAIEGLQPAEGEQGEGNAHAVQSVIRGVVFNATKFTRVRLSGGSAVDACSFQASAIKDLALAGGAAMREFKVIDSAVSGVEMEGGAFQGGSIERSNVQGLKVKGTVLERVGISAAKVGEVTIAGGAWKDVRFRRDALGLGGGGRECGLQESVFENCTLTECEFAGCTFRRTTLRNLALGGIRVRNVDFTGLILDSEEAFRKAAGLA